MVGGRSGQFAQRVAAFVSDQLRNVALLPIIASLLFGKKRFSELEKEIPKITPRMLSKELRDLEANGMVRRVVHDTVPVTIIYELTESGQSFRKVLEVMLEWGMEHRKRVMGAS
ncbi:MAG: transcriptional regulator [Bacteroidetes bacterium]|nr:MAG: transcriptional regulator [Bacteroidota bacterium]